MSHPYTYISALYNLIVCVSLGVGVTFSRNFFLGLSNKIKKLSKHKEVVFSLFVLTILSLLTIWFNLGDLKLLIFLSILITVLVSILAEYYLKYDPEVHLEGLTIWSVNKAKEKFKGGKLNDVPGERVIVNWKERIDSENFVNFSINDMKKLKVNTGDIVYVCDVRKYLGGLKSIHSYVGEPHQMDGIILISAEHKLSAQFQDGKLLYAEKEM